MLPDLASRPLWAVLVSMIAAGAILFCGRAPNLRETISFGAALIKWVLVVSLVPVFFSGQVIEITPLSLAPGLELKLRVDALGMLFALVSSTLWLVTSVYSVGYMRATKEKHQTSYFAAFALCVSAAVGLAFSANLLTFFVFYEILTIATYPLVVHKRTDEARRAGRKYLAYTLVSGQALFIGVVWCNYLSPGAEFQPGGFLAGTAATGSLIVLFILLICGTAVKAGVMPLHGWLPAAMVAPTPVSALLHAVAVVKAGVFGVFRVVGYVFGTDLLHTLGVGNVLAVFAGITIVTASVIALGQDNLKKRLAYSTVSQLSYIVLGAALATPAALLGAAIHIVNHAFMKITLFFCAGAIYAHEHKTEISELDGIGRRMPWTMGAFTVAALGIAGTPLLAGFVSKWNLGLGALQGGKWPYVLILVLSAILNIAYFFPIIVRAFFGAPEKKFQVKEAKWTLVAPLVITAVVSVILGVWPNLAFRIYDLATLAAHGLEGATPKVAGGIF